MFTRISSQIDYFIFYLKYFLLIYIAGFKEALAGIYSSVVSDIAGITKIVTGNVFFLVDGLKQLSLNLSLQLSVFINSNKTLILIVACSYLGVYLFGYVILYTIRLVRFKTLSKKNTLLFSLIKKLKKHSIKHIFEKEFYVQLSDNIGGFVTKLITNILLLIDNKFGNLRVLKEPEFAFNVFYRVFFIIIKITDFLSILVEKGLVAIRVLRPKAIDETLFLTTLPETNEEHLQRVIPEELQHEFHLTGEKQLNEYIDFTNAYKKPVLSAFDKWNENILSSMLFIGKKGSGKSALIDLLMHRVPRETDIIKIEMDPDEYRREIINNTLIKITGTSSFEKACGTLESRDKHLVVILDNIHFLFFKERNNFTGFINFLSMIGNSGNNILWIATINEHSYKFISQIMPINDTFDFKINLNYMKTKDIKNIFIKKTEARGYSIYPRLSSQQVKIAKKKIKKGEITYADLPNYILNEYFGKLVDNCENVFPALYHYFLHSIAYVRNNRVYINEASFRDLNFAQNFEDNYYLILTAIIIHEMLTIGELNFLLNIDKDMLNVYLSFLIKHRIVEKIVLHEKTYFRIVPVYTIQISKILQGKNFLYF